MQEFTDFRAADRPPPEPDPRSRQLAELADQTAGSSFFDWTRPRRYPMGRTPQCGQLSRLRCEGCHDLTAVARALRDRGKCEL